MTRIHDRQRAIQLRKQGKTYNEIRKELGVPKSTLSGWLSKFLLSNEQFALLEKNKKLSKYLAIEKTRNTKQIKREKRLAGFAQEEKEFWLPLNEREIKLAGIFLYWGEGKKFMKGPLSLNNTDPRVLKFTMYWMKNALNVPIDKIRVELHLYKDMDITQEMRFWSKELQIPISQFYKPYIKLSKRSDIDQKGFGHGTCGLSVNNIRLKEKIMMAIEAISQHYSQCI